MKKILTAFCVLAIFTAPAQTLFTYGKVAVPATDFIRAFQKNNAKATTEKGIKDYLDLYIASRLKVAEAKESGFDTLPQLVTDLSNLRQQILPNYLNDKESLNKLVAEAFERSQKDIRAAHIFIAFTKGGITDSAAAKKRRDEVLQKLRNGEKFEEVAKQYSDDPSAQTNGGDLGWVTVFSLPYELENLLYKTNSGATSAPYQSKAGYHIFKNGNARKAVGKIKASQILLAFPPGVAEATKATLKKRADSIYHRLKAGDDFGKLVSMFSNDVISSASNGQLQEFGVGEFEPVFENAVYGLPKDGAISKPFLTAHGYHIVQRIKLVPVAVKLNAATAETFRNKIEQNDRIQTTKAALAQKVLKTAGYKKLLLSDAELWAYSDSILSYLPTKMNVTIKPNTSLLKIGDKTITVNDWMMYAQTFRFKADGSGTKPYPQLWDDFVQATALQYYSDHLESFNEDFNAQLSEFAEGNLFFEIMQRKIWTPAQADSVALTSYYNTHKNNYYWKQSADAVVFYATDAALAKDFYKELKGSPAAWKQTISKYSEKITADSARFELTQLPNGTGQQLSPRLLTSPVVNKGDNTASFAYIIRLHPAKEPRSFTEAKGLVINDYQLALEKSWVNDLKKKYPVSVNEKVWQEVVKKVRGK
jgi:peptidyl-prolyl cis-trans isomerase SurA